MATTTVSLNPTSVRVRLTELLGAATAHAAAEEHMRTIAEDLGGSDATDTIEDALYSLGEVHHAVREGIAWACHNTRNPEESGDGLAVCASIQRALEVLDFAIEKEAAGVR